jgi:hypothetical protein
MNLIDNGAFDGNLNEWSGTGTINRALGYPRLGCVQLAVGQSISQDVGISEDQFCTLHFFYRLDADAISLTAGYGAITQSFIGIVDAWQEGFLSFALDAGANDNITFTAVGGTIYVDSVTLLYGGLPITRAEIATRILNRLGTLGSDAALSSVATDDSPEGDYSEAIDDALRGLAAVDTYGYPDVTRVTPELVQPILQSGYTSMLQQLRAQYALETDVTLGPRRESRSQIAISIDAMLGGGSGGGSANKQIGVGRLSRSDGWQR